MPSTTNELTVASPATIRAGGKPLFHLAPSGSKKILLHIVKSKEFIHMVLRAILALTADFNLDPSMHKLQSKHRSLILTFKILDLIELI